MQKNNAAKAVRTTKPIFNVKNVKIAERGKSSVIVIVTLACLIVGILLGGLSLHFLIKNDCFEMIAYGDTVDLEIGGEGNSTTYEELGVKCVAFGQDVKDSVSIKYFYREDITHDVQEVTEINPDKIGFYYAVYTSSNVKYRHVQLIRNVVVVGAEE